MIFNCSLLPPSYVCSNSYIYFSMPFPDSKFHQRLNVLQVKQARFLDFFCEIELFLTNPFDIKSCSSDQGSNGLQSSLAQHVFCGSQKIVLGEIRAMQVYTMTRKNSKNCKKYLHSTISYKYKIVLWKFFYAGSQIRAVQIRAMRNRASRGMTVAITSF